MSKHFSHLISVFDFILVNFMTKFKAVRSELQVHVTVSAVHIYPLITFLLPNLLLRDLPIHRLISVYPRAGFLCK